MDGVETVSESNRRLGMGFPDVVGSSETVHSAFATGGTDD